jgi:hypothetical protein
MTAPSANTAATGPTPMIATSASQSVNSCQSIAAAANTPSATSATRVRFGGRLLGARAAASLLHVRCTPVPMAGIGRATADMAPLRPQPVQMVL